MDGDDAYGRCASSLDGGVGVDRLVKCTNGSGGSTNKSDIKVFDVCMTVFV